MEGDTNSLESISIAFIGGKEVEEKNTKFKGDKEIFF